MENAHMATYISRRKWTSLTLTGLTSIFILPVLSSCRPSYYIPTALKGTPAASAARDVGIVLGIQTYSFRNLSLDEAISAMKQLDVKSCELWEGHVEPRELQWAAGQTSQVATQKNEALKKWRNNLDYSTITTIKNKLDQVGISIIAYTSTIKEDASDNDIETSFKIAKALGTNTINSSAQVSVMKRIDEFAKKYKTKVAMHNHSHTERPNEFSSPESFSKGMAGLSRYICINLDLGHFTAANFDAVGFLQNNHERILSIHLKDRKKNQGLSLPFGEGDTPIKEILHMIRDKQWPIPVNIEYDYKGDDAFTEVKKCLTYCKNALLQTS